MRRIIESLGIVLVLSVVVNIAVMLLVPLIPVLAVTGTVVLAAYFILGGPRYPGGQDSFRR